MGRGASKAGASTTCQKCLQKGHYSYECKTAVQERPYASRPSRSQQLMNPQLRPTITDQALEDSDKTAEKKGLADKILEKNAAERRRKRGLDHVDEP
ncbi:hypothetical protein CAC42_6606 [Sphaceloma murrayae]|uniref:Zinc knuckle-domain-containing protein n=1 Tax=Sphaceloma murrayae TaxID=2082308 RepID=A0A2K1QGW5_9PEZI|nr:hypothetical protein CAC42_6606 [Sphaceloma murrayae]